MDMIKFWIGILVIVPAFFHPAGVKAEGLMYWSCTGLISTVLGLMVEVCWREVTKAWGEMDVFLVLLTGGIASMIAAFIGAALYSHNDAVPFASVAIGMVFYVGFIRNPMARTMRFVSA